jgi:DNA-binding PadR family transcriptional regulator
MNLSIGQVEQHVLLAVLRKHPNAYGVSICEELTTRTGSEPAIATVYATLEKLDRKGFVKSRQGPATAERGGRAKIFFEVTGLGHKALNASLNALDNLREGVQVGKVAT